MNLLEMLSKIKHRGNKVSMTDICSIQINAVEIKNNLRGKMLMSHNI